MFSWLKRRDAKFYPDDDMGNALYELCPTPDKLPQTVLLWYDAYFDRQADADAFAAYCQDRRLEINRDHDEDPGEDLGAWSVDVAFPVKAQHLHLKAEHESNLRRIADYHGKLGSWLLLPNDG